MGSGLPSAAEREQFHRYFRTVAPLSDSELAPVDAAARVRAVARGDSFLRAGDVATECGTILVGVMREYYPLADGREVTRNFAGPGDGVGSLSDLLSGEPARSAVVAESPARIITMPWSVLRDAAASTPAWTRFLGRVTERLYLAKAMREYELLALDAEARYLRFRTRFAALEAEIPLRQVASYLGITPEHLSRLRRRLAPSLG
jgi:CRP-like cAMP-binding protein